MEKRYRTMTLVGIGVIFLVGSVWHFLFDWLGSWRPIGWLAPVNESVWEHFKMVFWPGLLWAWIEFKRAGKALPAFWFGKAWGLLAMPLIIGGIFYTYTALWPRYLPVDILSFLVAIAAGQFISYKLATRPVAGTGFGRSSSWIGRALIGLMALAFVVFTYVPPHVFLFEHVPTHEYGILTGAGM